VRVDGQLEEKAMKLTIVGAVVIVAVAILLLLVLNASLNVGKHPPQPDNAAEH
jgi:hypothetical protein